MVSKSRQDRVKKLEAEADELYRKAERLYAFVHSPQHEFIGEHMQRLLRQQYGLMLAYLDVLRQRIAAERVVIELNQLRADAGQQPELTDND